jgi:hypothetical protein
MDNPLLRIHTSKGEVTFRDTNELMQVTGIVLAALGGLLAFNWLRHRAKSAELEREVKQRSRLYSQYDLEVIEAAERAVNEAYSIKDASSPNAETKEIQ